ncbi:hypothetical protein ACJX0J_014206, partial [Zea mays]
PNTGGGGGGALHGEITFLTDFTDCRTSSFLFPEFMCHSHKSGKIYDRNNIRPCNVL